MNRREGTTPLGFSFTWGEDKIDFDYQVRVPKYARNLKWTTTPPTVEGWYWVINAKGEMWCDKVFIQDSAPHWYNEDEHMYNPIILDYFTHWLGPLPVPDAPEG